VISPLSIGTALQWARGGGRGRTASQMRGALHLAPTQPLASLIPNAGKARLHISTTSGCARTSMCSAYSHTLNDASVAACTTVDFSIDQGRKTINATCQS